MTTKNSLLFQFLLKEKAHLTQEILFLRLDRSLKSMQQSFSPHQWSIERVWTKLSHSCLRVTNQRLLFKTDLIIKMDIADLLCQLSEQVHHPHLYLLHPHGLLRCTPKCLRSSLTIHPSRKMELSQNVLTHRPGLQTLWVNRSLLKMSSQAPTR
jgi:hypothetical protein